MNELPHILKTSSRAKQMRITITADASVIVTIPQNFSLQKAEKIIEQHREWIERNIKKVKQRAPRQPLPKLSKKEMQIFEKKALLLVIERLQYFNVLYKFSWRAVTIRNQKTRWGSCSTKGNLNFNYKIAILPPHLIDYIVVHELCHLREMNHSGAFWSLVEQSIPEYKKARLELRKVSI